MPQSDNDAFDALLALLSARLQPPEGKPYLRLLHGRGGNIEAAREWHIDQLGRVLLVVAYRAMLWERARLESLWAWAQSKGMSALWLQRRYENRAPVSMVWGDAVSDSMVVQEAGLRYELRFANQNIGLFPDMAEGRRWVQASSSGARVLNLFAYTCGFSVAAISGGAAHVTNIDMSKSSLEWGRKNHLLNNIPQERTRFLGHDLMKSFGKIGRLAPFDLIIADPPSFQRGSFEANKDYRRLLKRMAGWLSPQGRALCCLNDPICPMNEFQRWITGETGLEIASTIETHAGQVNSEQTQALKMVLARNAGHAGGVSE